MTSVYGLPTACTFHHAGDYRIIASYTGSKDGAFLASVGVTPMFVSILTFPIVWSKVDMPAQKLQQMQILRDFVD